MSQLERIMIAKIKICNYQAKFILIHFTNYLSEPYVLMGTKVLSDHVILSLHTMLNYNVINVWL